MEVGRDATHYVIEGGAPLRGDVRLSGAKNAVTKCMVASMLSDAASVIRNCPPKLGDVTITEEVMRALGSEVTWQDTSISTRTRAITNTVVPMELGRKNRLAVLTVGPLLHRTGRAVIPVPGGDRIGPRPINFHLAGLQQMGATIEDRDGLYHFHTDGLKGATIALPYPSVMATETLLIAATLANGITLIENAAIEPEIIDLIKFLQKMGAIIEQRVDRKIVIEGVRSLHGADHRVVHDRNEAVSLAVAAYLTHGDIRLIGADQGTLLTFLNTLYRVGLDFSVEDDAIRFFGSDSPPRSIALETDVHPGFMTDWQQPFTVLLTQAHGMSVIHETVFADRFAYTVELNRMGADTGLYPKCLGELECRFRERDYLHSCIVRGPTPLHGADLKMPDIRAGASYLLAALTASGTSRIWGIEHIERGYDDLLGKLRSLGARIERVEADA
ncbi:MAG TPA: UDP-N-acetylglucosamine 1-carboxyvinyltransferase [Ktedonobacterales bacterium]|nr:UDP-N-acetylglucosamine 1-carboxyvinyltransferase [Ktedonobacterales bacterium]